MDKLFDINLPGPYWLHHALIALLIMLIAGLLTWSVAAGWMAGLMFYVGREFRDREKLGTWDWPGLISPVAATTIAYLVIFML